jgi:hypothetical protein
MIGAMTTAQRPARARADRRRGAGPSPSRNLSGLAGIATFLTSAFPSQSDLERGLVRRRYCMRNLTPTRLEAPDAAWFATQRSTHIPRVFWNTPFASGFHATEQMTPQSSRAPRHEASDCWNFRRGGAQLLRADALAILAVDRRYGTTTFAAHFASDLTPFAQPCDDGQKGASWKKGTSWLCHPGHRAISRRREGMPC